MKKRDFIEYWLKSSKHDLNVAESLFSSKHFDYCLFLSHLALEKLLKAWWVKDNNNKGNNPPKTHNLVYLAQHTSLELSDEQLKYLQFVNTFNIGVRYPDYKFKVYQKCTKDFTEKHFKKVKEFYKWLIEKL